MNADTHTERERLSKNKQNLNMTDSNSGKEIITQSKTFLKKCMHAHTHRERERMNKNKQNVNMPDSVAILNPNLND